VPPTPPATEPPTPPATEPPTPPATRPAARRLLQSTIQPAGAADAVAAAAAPPASAVLPTVDRNALDQGQANERKAKTLESPKLEEAKTLAENKVAKAENELNDARLTEKNALDSKQKAEKTKNKFLQEKETSVAASLPSSTATFNDQNLEGVLRVQNGKARQQHIFLKYKLVQLTGAIEAAHMRIYKTDGAYGLFEVRIADCTWDQKTITFDNSVNNKNLAQGDPINQGPSVFPDYSPVWVDVKLNAATVQDARNKGGPLCFRISGGPEYTSDVISSQDSHKPELRVQTYTAEMQEVSMLDEADEY